MESSREPIARRFRPMGTSVGVMVFTVAVLLSGCYYRGRPPAYGHRGYDDHRHDRRY
jgi:hypothetical protein